MPLFEIALFEVTTVALSRMQWNDSMTFYAKSQYILLPSSPVKRTRYEVFGSMNKLLS